MPAQFLSSWTCATSGPTFFVDAVPEGVRRLARVAMRRDFHFRDSALGRADVVLSMTEPWLKWALTVAGRERGPWDQVFYLGTYREASRLVPNEIQRVIDERLRDKLVVVYMGQFASTFDPGIAIDAARRLVASDDVVFLMAGDGVLDAELRRAAVGLPNVVFTGWVDSPAMAALPRVSDLGLVTTGRSGEREFVPNKVFNYLSEGVPVASQFDGELKEIIDRYSLGFTFSNADDLVQGVGRLASKREELATMSSNATEFFEVHGDAGVICPRYADLIERVVITKGGGTAVHERHEP